MGHRYDDYGWGKYVSVAERKQNALKHIEQQKKKGIACNPITLSGRNISNTFWGKAWCQNLEAYTDFENRLPRGRTYVRNGSVIDLQITKGIIKAQVMGSSLYHITIKIQPVLKQKWKELVKACTGQVNSMIELLQGKFSTAVMEIITHKDDGLFPKPKEISMDCSCPDSARMCKHVAAVLYGIGASLDNKPEGLFTLRDVDHFDLLSASYTNESLLQSNSGSVNIDENDLSALFGIEIETGSSIPLTKKVDKAKIAKKPKLELTSVSAPQAAKSISPKIAKPKAIKTAK